MTCFYTILLIHYYQSFCYWLICLLTQPGEDEHSTWQVLSHLWLPGWSIILDHHQVIRYLPPECWVITPCEAQPGLLVCWVEYLIFYPSVRTARFEVTRWTFYLTMSYFLPVSYLLVQCILIILPKNIKLHTFLRVYIQQAYQHWLHVKCGTGIRMGSRQDVHNTHLQRRSVWTQHTV